MRPIPKPATMILLATLAACSKAPDKAAEASAPIPAIGQSGVLPSASPVALPLDGPPQPPGDDPATFVPLRSQAVKDAIHRALRSGETQRWQDGKLGGYAVPSLTTGANGCRAVRYTVDQRPGASYESITACDASR
jgi:hypothetical protein